MMNLESIRARPSPASSSETALPLGWRNGANSSIQPTVQYIGMSERKKSSTQCRRSGRRRKTDKTVAWNTLARSADFQSMHQYLWKLFHFAKIFSCGESQSKFLCVRFLSGHQGCEDSS